MSGTLLYDNQSRIVEVVGVMNDFNYSTLHKNIEGFLLWMLLPHCKSGKVIENRIKL